MKRSLLKTGHVVSCCFSGSTNSIGCLCINASVKLREECLTGTLLVKIGTLIVTYSELMVSCCGTPVNLNFL